MGYDFDFNTDGIDFGNQKRGKGKNKPSPKRWSFFVVEGLIVLIAMVAGGRFLFTDNAEVSHLQATIDAQQSQSPSISAEALFNRALDEVENGLSSDAMRSFDLAIELNPTYADAYFERGQLRYDLEQYYYAATDYELALEFHYDDRSTANYNLGRAQFEQGNYSQAIRALTTVIDLDSDDGADMTAAAYYWRGRAYASSYDYQNGIDDILYGIEMGYEEDEYSYFWLAKTYTDAEDYDSAIRYYTISIRHSVGDCEDYECWIDYNNRGVASFWLEDYETAIKDYTSAIQANPDAYPLAFQNRGNAYEQLDNMTLALSDWNTMFLLTENNPITRSLTSESRILRGELKQNDSQIHVEFEGTADEKVTISLTVPESSGLDAMLMLRDKNDNPIAYSVYGDIQDAELTDIVLPTTGTYTIVVASDLAQSSGEFTLRLE